MMTLKQILAFMADHGKPPEIWVDEKIVAQFRGKSIKTLQRDRWKCRGLPYRKDGHLVRYWFPEIYRRTQEGIIEPEVN